MNEHRLYQGMIIHNTIQYNYINTKIITHNTIIHRIS